MTGTQSTLPILTYHAIADSRSPVAVAPVAFRRQVEALASGGWRTLSLDQLLEGHRTGAWPVRTCMLTFDDGYRSVLEQAAPVLVSHGFTATVFVIADRAGTRSHWPGQMQSAPDEDLLGWSGVTALLRAGFSVGAHSRTHARLDRLDANRLQDEVGGARRTIEGALGVAVDAFAYPFGIVDERVKAIVGSQFRAAFGTRMGYVRRTSDRFALERLDAYYFRGSNLIAKLDGRLAASYVRLRAAGRAVRGLAIGQ